MKEKEKYMAKTTLLLENIYKREQFFLLLRSYMEEKAINCVIFLIAATFITKSRNQRNSVTKKLVLSFIFFSRFSFFY